MSSEFKTTRNKILKSAAKLFARKGFEGVSISQIAKKSSVTQSLIYHYFESKSDLWKNVKKYYLEKYMNESNIKLFPEEGLKVILEKIIVNRINFYEKNPEIIRMMTWQKLESHNKNLIGGSFFAPNHWKEVFLDLQKNGQIKKEINVQMIILFIHSLTSGTISEDFENLMKEPKEKQSYINLMINSAICMFTN